MNFFRIMAKLGMDTTGFEVGLKKAESLTGKASKDFARSAKGWIAGAFGGAAIAAGMRNAVQYAGAVADLSVKLGETAEMTQHLDYALKQNGASADDLATVYRTLAKARKEAMENPAGDQSKAFSSFGINQSDLATAKTGDLVLKIGDGFKNAANVQAKLNDGVLLMGRSAQSLIPAMVDGLRDLVDESKNLGMAMDQSVIDNLDRIGDKADMAKGKLRSMFGEATSRALVFGETLYSTLKNFFVGTTTYFQARSRGASADEAMRAAALAGAEDIKAGVASDEAGLTKRERRRKALAGGLDFSGIRPAENIEETSFKFLKPDLNSLQQLGAFSSSTGQFIAEQKKANAHLAKISQNIDRIANKGTADQIEYGP